MKTKASIVYLDFDGQQKQHTVDVCEAVADQGVYLWGEFGCGKTRATPEAAAREYLGGRQLVSVQSC